MVRGSYPRQRQAIFIFFKTSRLGAGRTQPPIEWVPASFPGNKAAGAWSWLLATDKRWVQRMNDAVFPSTLHTFIRCTGTDSPSYIFIIEVLWVMRITICYLWSFYVTLRKIATSLCSSQNPENLMEMFSCYATRKQSWHWTSTISLLHV